MNTEGMDMNVPPAIGHGVEEVDLNVLGSGELQD